MDKQSTNGLKISSGQKRHEDVEEVIVERERLRIKKKPHEREAT